MAKISHQPSSRKRKRAQDDAVAAPPLRRSRRVAFRDSFRFNDLPRELRDEIYGMALRNEVSRDLAGTSLLLTGKMTAEAKALSQVSRSVRAESMSIYYSENTFHAHLTLYWNSMGSYRAESWTPEVFRVEQWCIIFGELVAPLLPSLRLDLAKQAWHTYQAGSVDFKESVQPLTWTAHQDQRFERSNTSMPELEAFALAVLRPQGKVVRTATALRLFLLGLQLITEQHSISHSNELHATALLYLESQTELQKYLPHIKLSPTPYTFDFT
jgi:hypothetical protein